MGGDTENLPAIDLHFWDWTLWLRDKEATGQREFVSAELDKLCQYLLAPLGVLRTPASVSSAIAAYRDARAEAERRLAVRLPRNLESEVVTALDL